MVTIDLLHHYPILSTLTNSQLKNIVEISREESYPSGTVLFEENDQARWLYILLKGSIDLYFAVDIGISSVEHREMLFDTIRSGEIFGISALIEPYLFTSSARTTNPSTVLKIQAEKLLSLCEKDERLAYKFMDQVAKATIERLNVTRLQLATAWSTTHA